MVNKVVFSTVGTTKGFMYLFNFSGPPGNPGQVGAPGNRGTFFWHESDGKEIIKFHYRI